MIEEWTTYVSHFPFLNLVIGLCRWDDRCPEYRKAADVVWQAYFKGEYNEDDLVEKLNVLNTTDYERKDFEEVLQIGIWVHDRMVEIMNAERTVKVYQDYEKLYEEQDTRIYMPEYYSAFYPDIVSRTYLHRCILAYGIDDPEENQTL